MIHFYLKDYPNIIIPIFGGYLTDKIGDKEILIFSTLIILIGWIVVTYGIVVLSYYWMLIGTGI